VIRQYYGSLSISRKALGGFPPGPPAPVTDPHPDTGGWVSECHSCVTARRMAHPLLPWEVPKGEHMGEEHRKLRSSVAVTASTAAAALGCDRYKSRLTLWHERLGRDARPVSDYQRANMDRGNRLEPDAISTFELVKGACRPCGFFRNPSYPFIGATPDAIHLATLCPVEVKTTLDKNRMWPPYEHWIQCQVEAFCVGAPGTHYFIYHPDPGSWCYYTWIPFAPDFFDWALSGFFDFKFCLDHQIQPEQVRKRGNSACKAHQIYHAFSERSPLSVVHRIEQKELEATVASPHATKSNKKPRYELPRPAWPTLFDEDGRHARYTQLVELNKIEAELGVERARAQARLEQEAQEEVLLETNAPVEIPLTDAFESFDWDDVTRLILGSDVQFAELWTEGGAATAVPHSAT
jgi:hypothetical protein